MALLSLLLMAYGGRIVAAHLEHGFRKEASIADAEFVASFCRASGITCHVRHSDVAALRRQGESAEMAGRRVRYEFFGEILERENLQFVATAHNAGDVVETMAHHFFRGTGIAGLSGIACRRGGIVRPLLRCSREGLRKFLTSLDIPWREDSTNDENRYTRNKIRNELLPWVRSNLNESADRSVLGLADECSRLSSRLAAEAKTILRLVARNHPFALAAWDSRAARRLSDTQLPSALRLQADLLGLPALDRKRLDEAGRLLKSGERRRFQWAGDVELCCDNCLSGWISREALAAPREISLVLGSGEKKSVEWGPWTIELEMKRRDSQFSNLRSGASVIELSSDDESGVAVISGANSLAVKNNFVFHVRIPWWSADNTPVISWKSAKSFDACPVGVRRNVRCDGLYVIIAHVFSRAKRRVKGEKF
jgi:tRNA(Ile)-lysidine synthase